ncbi:hypothetical protein B0H21DRAFT_346870 [Amylocystis lapponica]|nr:hypothetical protein B0H21DRAFT_346870 [Amylocystis lapponica]
MSYTTVPFPGGASPVMLPQQFPSSPAPQAAQIQPGSITYTTTVGADGQVIYHPFRAVAASYQTNQGLISGIQWIPAEATQVLPAGATPAAPEIIASFGRQAGQPDGTTMREWQREEDRRRRKDKDRRARDRDDDKDLRRARDRDGREREHQRERRLSNSGYNMYGGADLDRRFNDLDLDREREHDRREYETERKSSTGYTAAPRSRRGSTYGDRPTTGYQPAPGGAYPSVPGAYPTPPGSGSYASPGGYNSYSKTYPPPSPRPGDVLPRPVSPYQQPGGYPPGGMQRPVSPYQPGAVPRPVSPYQQPGMMRSASPRPGGSIYPTGHIMEGQPMRPISRAPSPAMPGGGPYASQMYGSGGSVYASGGSPYAPPSAIPYGASAPYGGVSGPVSPRMPSAVPEPEGFSRPPNRAHPYTHFEIMKIQDMDDFLENMPRMPLVLVPHDVYHEDWIRLMNDLAMSWSGRLPVPEYARDGRPPKRTTLTADLIDLWNTSFFLPRGVELVLYKGRERRSGRSIGTVDLHLPGYDTYDSVSSASDSSSEDSEDSADERLSYGAYGGGYRRQVEGQMAELREARRLRREKKADHKKRKMEKKRRQKLKELERKYSLYLTCTSPREGGLGPQIM